MDVKYILLKVVTDHVVSNAQNLFDHDWRIANGIGMQESDQAFKARQISFLFRSHVFFKGFQRTVINFEHLHADRVVSGEIF